MQNPFPRPHFACPTAAVMAEDKKAAALRLVLSACAQNGFFRECATTCSHLGALLFKFPSLYVSPFVRTLAELKRSASFGAHLCSNSRRSVLPHRRIAPFLRFLVRPNCGKLKFTTIGMKNGWKIKDFPQFPTACGLRIYYCYPCARSAFFSRLCGKAAEDRSCLRYYICGVNALLCI